MLPTVKRPHVKFRFCALDKGRFRRIKKFGDVKEGEIMALLMVHLRVAQAWAARHSEFAENPEFYLGAISPDAIHIRGRQ